MIQQLHEYVHTQRAVQQCERSPMCSWQFKRGWAEYKKNNFICTISCPIQKKVVTLHHKNTPLFIIVRHYLSTSKTCSKSKRLRATELNLKAVGILMLFIILSVRLPMTSITLAEDIS